MILSGDFVDSAWNLEKRKASFRLDTAEFAEDCIIGGRQGHSADIEKWLAVIRADGVGPKAFARLLKHFGSLDGVLGASVSEFAKVKRIGYKTAERIAASIGKFDVAKELALADKSGVWIVHAADKRYPPALKAIYDPPPVLYVNGTLERADSLAVALYP